MDGWTYPPCGACDSGDLESIEGTNLACCRRCGDTVPPYPRIADEVLAEIDAMPDLSRNKETVEFMARLLGMASALEDVRSARISWSEFLQQYPPAEGAR